MMQTKTVYKLEDDDQRFLINTVWRWLRLTDTQVHLVDDIKEVERLRRNFHHVTAEWFDDRQKDDAVRFVRVLLQCVVFTEVSAMEEEKHVKVGADWLIGPYSQFRVIHERNAEAWKDLHRALSIFLGEPVPCPEFSVMLVP